MIFEDAHWTEPTSLEAFGRMGDQIRPFRVLLLAAFRPEFVPPWIGQPHVASLTINRMAARDAMPSSTASRETNQFRQSVRRESSSAPTASHCSSRR